MISTFFFPSPKPQNKKDCYLQRFLEITPAIITLSILAGCFYFSYSRPVAVAFFIILFDLYWLLKVGYFSSFIISAYRRIKIWEAEDWLEKCKTLEALQEQDAEKNDRRQSFREIYHLVVLPTYKEDIEILKESINSIINSDYPKDRMILILAFASLSILTVPAYIPILSQC